MTSLPVFQLKRLVAKLRGKGSTHKKRRAELAELKAENGVLERTEEVLRQRNQDVLQQLVGLPSVHKTRSTVGT